MSRPAYLATPFLTVLALLIGPSTALANEFTDTALFLGSENAEITLSATAPLGDPRVHTYPGEVRLWFPDMSDVRMDRDGDREVIQRIELRGGANDSAVVIIKLADNRRLAAEVVSIERGTGGARIRIPRSALPSASPAATPAEDPPVAETSETASATEVPPDNAESTEEANRESPADAVPLTGSPNRDRGELLAPRHAASSGLDFGVMIFITLLLGLVYIGTKFLKKRKIIAVDDIQVVSTKRLGARHQLVIVRALGEDHLLSVQGSQTTKIASLPSPEALDLPTSSESTPEELPSFLKPANVLSRLGNSMGLGPNKQVSERPTDTINAPVAPPPRRNPAPRLSSDNKFGAELLNLAAARRDRVQRGESEAIAGLLKLRRAAGQR